MSWGGPEKHRWFQLAFRSVCSDRLLEKAVPEIHLVLNFMQSLLFLIYNKLLVFNKHAFYLATIL